MGLIRLLLAVAVVVYHSYYLFGEKMTGGIVAVQAFYIISGFYMAMILNEKYTERKGSWKLFITNRFLRLYPVYWVVLIIAILVSVIGYYGWGQPFYLYAWITKWENMPWLAIVFFIFANLFMFGSDWMFFMGLNRESGALEFTKNCFNYKPMSMHFLFVPQIWTLGIELMFYFIAPFLVRKSWWIQLAIIVLSLGYRYYFYHEKFWSWDPWSYRFFPFEIALFLGGSLAYQLYVQIRGNKFNIWFLRIVYITIPLLIFMYPRADFIEESYRRWYFYVIVAGLIPFVFLYSKNMKTDRWIGELSFPLYIGHHVVMMVTKRYFWTHTEHMYWFGICTLAGSLIFAVFLWKFVVDPIEKIRQRRIMDNQPKTVTT